MENHRFTTIRMEIYGKSKISHSSPQSADCEYYCYLSFFLSFQPCAPRYCLRSIFERGDFAGESSIRTIVAVHMYGRGGERR